MKKTKGESYVVDSDEDAKWSNGMMAGEHIYVLSAAQTNQGTDLKELEIEDSYKRIIILKRKK